MNTSHLVALLENYKNASTLSGDVEQIHNAERCLDLIAAKPDTYWSRKEFDPGHITASSWVVNSERTHALLVNHLQFKQLVQLGGHIDPPDSDIVAACLREVREESGLEGTLVSNDIFDIDIHPIPARESHGEPAHTHFDIRMLVQAPFVQPQPPEGESREIAWYPIADIAKSMHGGIEGDSVARMAHKTLR